MADTIFLGKAVNQKQIATAVVANTWAQNDTYTLTEGGLDMVITIGTLVTTAQVATTIKQAFNGEPLTDTSATVQPTIAQGGGGAIPSMREKVATVSSSTVSFTAQATGPTGSQTQPFTMTSAASTSGDGDVTYTNAATAHDGKHEADNVDNWSAGAALANNDNVFFASGNVDLLDGLTHTVQPASVTISQAYTGKIGRPYINSINTNSIYHYPEYRTPLALTFGDNSVTTTYNIGQGEGSGSGRIILNTGAGQVLLNLFGQGAREIQGVPCVLWKGAHASNEINNAAGDLGVAWFGGETATIAALQTGNGPSSTARTACKSGTTLTTIICNGGYLSTDSAFTTGTQYNGTWEHGAGTGTTVNVLGGVFYPLKNATLTTLNVGSGGEFNTTRGTDPFTITNTIQLFKGAKLIDPQGRITNPVIKLNQCSPADVTLVLPANKTYTLS